jgi:hydrogenase maturation protein HypF
MTSHARPEVDAERVRLRIRVDGIVQGVGFRPFVHGLATGLGLAGFVGNDESGVIIEAEGAPAAVRALLTELEHRPPPLAVVQRVRGSAIPVRGSAADPTTFTIAASTAAGPRATWISPDIATCADCLAELRDPADRRYRYPFVNCTNCGPRFTIVTGVPYDRPATTMAGFPMCPACAAEYHDPTNRRFHAQPVCCPACGPRLRLLDADGHALTHADDAIAEAAARLRAGAVLAVKGLGGYHLAALAGGPVGEVAVAALRARKHREDKPFAVLAADVAEARRLVDVDDAAEALLTSRRRPIVLLPRRPDGPGDGGGRSPRGEKYPVANAVAPGNHHIGVMLPYTPLHVLLAEQVAEPIVLTSGNVSDEPIAYQDDEALERLRGIADGYLTHNRPIHIRTDDSVLRVVAGRPLPIRRSRGYAPEPLALAWSAPRPVLGCGAELKSTFCLARGGHAVLSHHIGDLENYATLRSFTTGVEHFQRLFDITPAVIAHDLHPEYLSTKYALDRAERAEHPVELVGVQHHHAHLASCLADNGVAGPVVGIACDGLGYGCDGTLWGGEVMVASLGEFRRVAHLEPVPMPGGAAAIREPWRMAAAYLRARPECHSAPAARALAARHGARWDQVNAVLDAGVNCPSTSSAGRLFDAVAALAGVRDRVNYEGQAAVELEQRAREHTADLTGCAGYPARLDGELLRGTDLVAGVLADLAAHRPVELVAARFHAGLVELLGRAAEAVRAQTGIDIAALSGGVFQNELLTRGLTARLTGSGFTVLTHHQVPPNDAGISLGQVAVAIAHLSTDGDRASGNGSGRA